MRLAGQDELVETQGVVLVDQARHLLVTTDQGGAGAAADQSDTGPDSGRSPACRPDRRAAQSSAADPPTPNYDANPWLWRAVRGKLGQQVVGHRPRCGRRVATDGVQPEAEPRVSASLLRQRARRCAHHFGGSSHGNAALRTATAAVKSLIRRAENRAAPPMRRSKSPRRQGR